MRFPAPARSSPGWRCLGTVVGFLKLEHLCCIPAPSQIARLMDFPLAAGELPNRCAARAAYRLVVLLGANNSQLAEWGLSLQRPRRRRADQARRDWLTGLLNRRGIKEVIDGWSGGHDRLPALGVIAVDIDVARAWSERLRRECERFAIDSPDGVIHLTVSIGYAVGSPGEPFEVLLRRADAALYRAKDAGRSRVIAARDLDRRAGAVAPGAS